MSKREQRKALADSLSMSCDVEDWGTAKVIRNLMAELEAEQARRVEAERRLDTIRAAVMRSRLFAMFFEQHFWHAHHVDIVWRYNGDNRREEADWLKDIWYALLPIKDVEQDGDETLVYLEDGSLVRGQPSIGEAEPTEEGTEQ